MEIATEINSNVRVATRNTVKKRSENGSAWTQPELTIFRITFVYLLLLCLPTLNWYAYIYNIDWSTLNCRDLFIVGTGRHWDYIDIPTESSRWGFVGYVNLFIPLFISIPVGWVWGQLDSKRTEYNILFYWIRVIARYRLGIGLVAWGFRKLLPGQMVLPTIGVLNTPFGDFLEQKLYWQAVGITPGYEVFLGFAEFIAGFLLFFRRTTTLGAALGFVVLLNIVLANHAYDGGVHLHSFFFVIISFLLLFPDVIKIWNLIYNETDQKLKTFYPTLKNSWLKYTRITLKAFTFGVFVILFFILQIHDYVYTPYRIPDETGLKGISGYYKVSTFKRNGIELPYSPVDTLRWQEAIFENWSTFNYRVNRPSEMDVSNGGGFSTLDIERSWELAGIGGGRRFFYYKADTSKQILYLQNKNQYHREERQVLRYTRPSDKRVILEGTDEFNDSIHVVLDKMDKNYSVINHY